MTEGVAEPRMTGQRGKAGAQHGQIAAAVAQAVLLLVGRFVLLVDNNQAEVGKRRKHR